MNLKCNQCGHSWEEAVDDGQPLVQCPECFATIPTVVAHQQEGEETIVESDPVSAPAEPEPKVEQPKPAAAAPSGDDDSNWTCPECGHQWQETIPSGQPLVQCEECFHTFPPVIGHKKDVPKKEKPPAPHAPTYSAPNPEIKKEEKKPEPIPEPTLSQLDTLQDVDINVEPDPDGATIGEPLNLQETAPDLETPAEPPPPEKEKKSLFGRFGKKKKTEPEPEESVHESPTMSVGNLDTVLGDDSGGNILVCPECDHEWEDETAGSQPMLQCPECFAAIPSALIKRKVGSSKEKTQDLKPTPKRKPVSPEAETKMSDLETGVFDSADMEGAVGEETSAVDPAQSGPPKKKSKIAHEMEHLIGKKLGGYEILKMLGAGGMGAVFLARQISLDRSVALKVLPAKFAKNPEAQARFMREALSAAQLNHHNVMQVYDVSEEDGQHFIVMEFVEGESLAEIIRRDGRLQVDDAAGYVLQAARGLKYAHERQIIHRDIKPDNLMLNSHGTIKIADMGLAKMIGASERSAGMPSENELRNMSANLTMAARGLGTPAYMPPEQARDASKVDEAADQYSLGCTMYYLCAGRAPYSGTTAFEIITKHMMDPITPLKAHIRNVPASFAKIIEKMLEKNPKDRYKNLDGVIDDLEDYLGVAHDEGTYKPREQHLAALELSQHEFYSQPLAKVRKFTSIAFFLVSVLLIFLCIFSKNPLMAGGVFGLLVLTPFLNFIVDGFMTKKFLFRRVRSLFFGMPIKSWLIFLGSVGMLCAALYQLNIWLHWAAFGLVALLMALGYQFGIARKLRLKRREPIEKMQDTLRELRVRGLSEEAIQDFVCRFSDIDWEEFFEELFGYEAMVFNRGKWGSMDKVQPRKKFATWRDPIAKWLDHIEESRKSAREKKRLAKVELKRLKAKGVDEKEANKKAKAAAEQFVSGDLVKMKEQAEEIEKKQKRKKQKKKTKKDEDIVFRKKKIFGMPSPAFLLQVLRLFIGGGIIFIWALNYSGQTSILGGMFPFEKYFAMGSGGKIIGLIAGVLVFLTGFSKHHIYSFLVLAGGILMVSYLKVVELVGVGAFNNKIAFTVSVALLVVGFFMCAMSKIGGGKF